MTVETALTVGFTNIDRMGIVHNSIYPVWFETARMKYLKEAGISSSRINALGLFLPLSELECKYKSPARINDELTITTSLTHISCVRVKFEYRVINRKDGKLLATGRTIHVWTDRSIRPLNVEKAAPEIYRRLKESAESTDDA